MESSSLQVGSTVLKQIPACRQSSSILLKNLWSATRQGSIPDVEAALLMLKRNGGNIDARNMFGLSALHIAVWRNHVPIVKRLLDAGSDPNARDGESGWSSLHRALHFGHLAVAGVLIEAGASLTLDDSKSRTPVDLVSGPVQKVATDENNAGTTELFSWGNGANYQLGTGNARIQKLPCKVEALQGLFVTGIAAAKFHSVAVTATGEVYTWGFGRGGRLGHPDFDIHSGQAAVITPRQVTGGLGQRRVKVIAAAKHHTIIATEGGEVFTWGSNREGQLGYTSVDTQPTPRRVGFLKMKVIAVAAANKHSAVVTEFGEVYTWGCNKDGQLGYGTSNSASNYVPRAVEYLKGKHFVAVSAAKYHTVVLGADGEVFTWGYKMVMPRRVMIARNTKKSGNVALKFHRMERLHVVAIAAGMTHSTALSDDGTVFYWISSDPHLHCQQIYSTTSSAFVAVSAGKYWTAVVTSTGDVYTWDGKKFKDDDPFLDRTHAIKRATSVSVSESHFLVVSAVYVPKYAPKHAEKIERPSKDPGDESNEIENDDAMSNDDQCSCNVSECVSAEIEKRVPSLKDLCQKVAAEFLVEPKNAVQLLDIAGVLGADDLRMHCEDLVLHNLDYILTICPAAFANVSIESLAKLEKSLDAKSSEPWSYRRLPTPTATFPAVIDSEDDDNDIAFRRLRNIACADSIKQISGERRSNDGFLHQTNAASQAITKQVRAIRKKLQQIEMLEMKLANGHSLDDQQQAKLQTKSSLETVLTYLESGAAIEPSKHLELESGKLLVLNEQSTPKGDGSRRRRRKGKNVIDTLSEVQIADAHGILRNEATIKGGLMKGQYESNYFKTSQDARHSIYDGEDGGTKIGEGKTSSSIQKPNLEACTDHDSNIILPTSKISGMSASGDHDLEVKPLKAIQFPRSSSKKKTKKGGLSVFLSGALDDIPKVAVPTPVMPKTTGPAWGGAKITKGSRSLREIQSEQIIESNACSTPESNRTLSKCILQGIHFQNESMTGTQSSVDAYELGMNKVETNHIPIPSSQLVHASAPSKNGACASDAEKSTSAWAGTSPLTSRSSLREIQLQQVKRQQSISQGLRMKSEVSPLTGVGSTVPLDYSQHVTKESHSCWFKPETDTPSPIRCIQIEEKAMKDLRRFYKNVKLVKNAKQ